MATFLGYLKSLKATLSELGPSSDICLTIGNESCDLDSVVCSLVYGYFTALKFSAAKCATVSLPILQCQSKDIVLSKEVTYVFELLDIDVSELIYQDDISPDVLSTANKLSLILVDHNSPTHFFDAYSSSVVKVIDHHHPSVDSVAGKAGVSTTMEMSGSCASLVTKELLEDASYTIEQTVSISLISAILLDTGNLKAAKRVTEADELAVEKLSEFLPSSFDIDAHYCKLFKARFDVSTLSVMQALQRDYKECTVSQYVIGFSTITASLHEFLSQSSANSDLMDFFTSHNLNALIVLGIQLRDPSASKVQRQIAVFQPPAINSDFSESIVNVLEGNDELKCERADVSGFHGVLLEQENTDMSRKDIIPIVTSFVKSIECEYPRTGVSPSSIVVQDSELASSAADVAATPQENFPLEPDVTVVAHTENSPSQSTMEDRVTVAAKPVAIPEYTSEEEFKERRSHRYVHVGGEEITINLDMVGPYKKIIQHAGYIGETRQALVIISACYLPPKSLPNYNHVVYHTFYYVLSVLDQLIVDDYVIVYLHSGAPRHSMPSLRVLHKFYAAIDRRLRKQLSQVFIVHPTFWVKTMLLLARPILSKKFWRKVHFIPTLQDLPNHVKVEDEYIPASVAAVDATIMSHQPARQKYQSKESADHSASGGNTSDPN